MQKEIRNVIYDGGLNVEAYSFQGIMQKFPNHFHDYYVIGFIEKGERRLTCGGRGYVTGTGDLLLLNPKLCHACEQTDGRTLDYRCINIRPEVMKKAALEITGQEYMPMFSEQVITESELVPLLKELHLMIMNGETDLVKEEAFYFLLGQIIEEHTEKDRHTSKPQSEETAAVRRYIEGNYDKNISLNDLANLTGLSKYHLLRLFTKENGITPYNYLSTLRIDKAKKLLQEGVSPMETAFSTGFSDQSHFSNFFKKLIGLTPKQYMKIFKDK